jgi:hypothetical protein
MSNDDDDKKKNSTKNNLTSIVLYALAIAAALGLNDLILTIFDKMNMSHGNQILSKVIYVVLMFVAVLVLSYYTHSTVPV